MDQKTITKLVAFGEKDIDIRAVILEGSQAVGIFTDDLSDYDINIFTQNPEPYLKKSKWLNQFGDVLIYQKEELNFYGKAFPNRLVVFKNGSRIDFSFWPVSALIELTDSDKYYESYRNGYRVLVDKDGLAKNLPKPDGQGFQITPPDRDVFLQTIYDFWFEANCIARALTRDDLWYAKHIEASYIKDHLYQMTLWEHQSRHGWAQDPKMHLGGKRFEQWAEPELLKKIALCFSSYTIEGTWKSLFAILNIFNGLAKHLAKVMGIKYPERSSRDVKVYLESLKSIK